jgi:glutamine amidotransferase
LGVTYHISGKPEDLTDAKRIIFPGVGAFGDAMVGLQERGLVEPLRAAAQRGIPFLGICVGCQLLLSRGEEFGPNVGLDLIPGVVSRLPAPRIGDPDAIRIPNVGWRPLSVRCDAPILGQVAPEDWMYFVHSYAPMVDDPANISATIAFNGQDIPVAISRDNIFGVQFHPERSGPSGLRLLAQFLEAKMEFI